MKKIWIAQIFLLATACSQKKANPPSDKGPVEVLSADLDCPPGVKNDCNVPSLTQDQIDTINAANKKCFEACVTARQMEAIGHEIIESECQQGCDEQHFVGQGQVAQTLENTDPQSSEGAPLELPVETVD